MSFFMKIFSVIAAFIVSVTSFPLSFLPFNNDTDFPLSGSPAYEKIEDDGTLEFDVNLGTEWFNYYALEYSSDSYVRGTVVYENGFGKEYSEEFFLEPAENKTFYSFIDGFLDGRKARNIVSVNVSDADGEDFDFNLIDVSAFNRKIPKNEIYISNGQYKIGVNLEWGGALSYMEDTDSSVEAVKKDGRIYVDSGASERYGSRAVTRHVNLINRHDTGRLIQQSYYGVRDSETYVNGYYTALWRYNPVQGGNMFGDSSKLVDLNVTDSSIYIKCRPMDWAKDAASIAPCYMEATYSFVENTVHTECRFVDFSGYEPTKTTQELPAFYCVEPLNRFVYYGGSEPWTDGEVSAEPDLPFWGGPNKKRFKATEHWAAFTGEFADSFGIGLYTPERDTFIPGVYERGNTKMKDPSKDNPTSYFAVAESRLFQSFDPFEYEFYLTTGTVDEIRNNIKTIAQR